MAVRCRDGSLPGRTGRDGGESGAAVACSADDAAGRAVDKARSALGARPEEGAALGQGGRRRGKKGRKEKRRKEEKGKRKRK
jgi:hypothetical protein